VHSKEQIQRRSVATLVSKSSAPTFGSFGMAFDPRDAASSAAGHRMPDE
jgi:hypothetical protein